MRMRTLQVIVLLIFALIVGRLAYIQLFDSRYDDLARANVLRHVVQYPPRGEVFDRNGEYLVQSRECYEIGKQGFDTARMCDVLGLSRARLERELANARMRPRAPRLIMNYISKEDKLRFDECNFRGFYTVYRTIRSYPRKIGGNLLGDVGEINERQLKMKRYADYRSGDYVGQSGVEKAYEEELRGKKIAVARGSSAHGQILLTLRKAGLTPKDVQLVLLQPADALGAFNSGDVAAWAIWDPYFSQVVLETGARVLADGTGTANGYDFQVAGTGALSDRARNTAVGDYLVRLARAMVFSDTHRPERAQAWAQDTGLPIEVTRKATDAGPNLPIPLDRSVVDSSQQLADAFVQAGEIPRPFRFADYVDTRFQQQLAAVR